MAEKTEADNTNHNPNKGESEERTHKGGPNASNKTKEKHEKDDSSGAEKNTTKKQENSI